MADIFRKIRLKFMYAFAASALLSGMAMYVLYKLFSYVYANSLQHKGTFAQLASWFINHIGKLPLALLIGGTMFAALFYFRSSKIEADIVQLLLQQANRMQTRGAGREPEGEEPIFERRYIPARKRKRVRLLHLSNSLRGGYTYISERNEHQ
ncbi:hypothetical protein [Paenibacillus sp. GCM10027626]|uniref:hypothetical protein n=1 Tax=Paenibacillus sp. GCM10027626 TaxID=3273411 RepID=UPI003627BA21